MRQRMNTIAVAMAMLMEVAYGQKYATEAKAAVERPIKVAVKPVVQGLLAGNPVGVEVQLQNGNSQPTPSTTETTVDVDLMSSSDSVLETTTCRILAASAAGRCSFPPQKPGLYKLRARPINKKLLTSTRYFMIRAKGQQKRKGATAGQFSVPGTSSMNQPQVMDPYRALLWNVAFAPASGQPPAPAAATGGDCAVSSGPARLILRATDGSQSGAFQARIENATIQAFYVADDGGSAPKDIRIWLSQDHGLLNVQNILIPKCALGGEATLSANYAVKVSISYTTVPKIEVDAPPTLSVAFVAPPIVGIGIVPNGVQTLSLIDRSPVVAQFFDALGNPVYTQTPRTVQFISNSTIVYPKDTSVTVQPTDLAAETVLIPSWMGSGSIYASAAGLPPSPAHPVQVVGMFIVALCLAGGVVGGVVAFFASGGKIYGRVIIGVAAAIVFSWAYVFGLLPKVDASVAHNSVSVVAISIMGGYLGIKAFDLVRQQLGWGA